METVETLIALLNLVFGLGIAVFNKPFARQTARYQEWLFRQPGLHVDFHKPWMLAASRAMAIVVGLGLAGGGVILLAGA